MIKSSNDEKGDMITTVHLLDMLKEKLGSDYKSAQALQTRTQRITALRNVGGVLTDIQGLKAAEILDLPKEWVLVSLAAERALNGPVFEILTHAAEKLDTRKVSAFVAFSLFPLAFAISSLPNAGM
jgi:hypothetical protein